MFSNNVNLSMENFVQYSPMGYDMVSHVLTLGFAVMLAALFYFVLTINTVAPRYRVSSVLSVVVMVSAFLILYFQAQSWINAFTYVPGATADVPAAVLQDGTAAGTVQQPGGEAGTVAAAAGGAYVRDANALAFTNGYRYLNWLIDVPMLLLQILFVVNLTAEQRTSRRNRFFLFGTLMIITGYIGQFFEVGNIGPFLIWGTISTVFFLIVLWDMYGLLRDSAANASPAAARWINGIWWLFLISWMLYPGAYLAPLLLDGAASLANPALPGSLSEIMVVGRQITFTIADITSKVIYGVMLTVVAQIFSREQGYVYETLGTTSTATAAGD